MEYQVEEEDQMDVDEVQDRSEKKSGILSEKDITADNYKNLDSLTPEEKEKETQVHSYNKNVIMSAYDGTYKDNLKLLMQAGFMNFN